MYFHATARIQRQQFINAGLEIQDGGQDVSHI